MPLRGCRACTGGHFGLYAGRRRIGAWLLHENRLLNDAIPSDQRATLISMDNIAYSLLMIPASPLVGAIGDIFGQAGAGLVLLGLAVASAADRTKAELTQKAEPKNPGSAFCLIS